MKLRAEDFGIVHAIDNGPLIFCLFLSHIPIDAGGGGHVETFLAL